MASKRKITAFAVILRPIPDGRRGRVAMALRRHFGVHGWAAKFLARNGGAIATEHSADELLRACRFLDGLAGADVARVDRKVVEVEPETKCFTSVSWL